MKRYKVFSLGEYFLLVCSLFLSLAFFYFNYQDLNYKAYHLLKNEKIEEALVYSQQAIEKNPDQLLNYLNLALSYDKGNLSIKAEEIYDRAVSRFLDKDIHSFFLYFNQGEFYSRLKSHTEKALQAYQKALGFNYKKDLVKKNIEWLFKKEKTKKDQNQGSENENSKDKDKEDNQTDKKEESQQENNQKNQSEKEDESREGDAKNQEESKEKQEGEREQEEKQEGGVGSNQEEEKFSGEEGLSKSFDLDRSQEIDEKAILEEIQKQESQARSRFYKGKRTFGDKTDKNW